MLSEINPNKRSGNYGLRDQLLALTWVRHNIQAFGGDPDLVTLFGQSSGGTSIFALLASPHLEGLFHRTISMSGSPILNKSLADASRQNLDFLQQTGCSDVECILDLRYEHTHIYMYIHTYTHT